MKEKSHDLISFCFIDLSKQHARPSSLTALYLNHFHNLTIQGLF